MHILCMLKRIYDRLMVHIILHAFIDKQNEISIKIILMTFLRFFLLTEKGLCGYKKIYLKNPQKPQSICKFQNILFLFRIVLDCAMYENWECRQKKHLLLNFLWKLMIDYYYRLFNFWYVILSITSFTFLSL